MKKNILFILIILWMGVIFYFSSMTADVSTRQSDGFISMTIGKIIDVFYDDISINEKQEIIENIKIPIRKLAHISEFFILTILVSLYINCYNIDIKRLLLITFIISFIYACSDEFHQLFVSGRSAAFIDVLIDSIGIISWLIIYYFYKRKEVLK